MIGLSPPSEAQERYYKAKARTRRAPRHAFDKKKKKKSCLGNPLQQTPFATAARPIPHRLQDVYTSFPLPHSFAHASAKVNSSIACKRNNTSNHTTSKSFVPPTFSSRPPYNHCKQTLPHTNSDCFAPKDASALNPSTNSRTDHQIVSYP